MKTLTANIQKGGTGKTAFIKIFGSWLAYKKNRVLYIDLDYSENLTDSFGIQIPRNNRVDIIFDSEIKRNITPVKIDEYQDLLASSDRLEKIGKSISEKANSDYILFMWIVDNYEWIKEYDYILIDTHNDMSSVTRNAFVVSDLVLGVTDASKDGTVAIAKLIKSLSDLKKELIDIKTRKSNVTAEFKFIGNEIPHNTNSSRKFVASVEDNPYFLGYIRRKELINQSRIDDTSIIEYYLDSKLYRKHKDFFEDTFELLNATKEYLDRIA